MLLFDRTTHKLDRPSPPPSSSPPRDSLYPQPPPLNPSHNFRPSSSRLVSPVPSLLPNPPDPHLSSSCSWGTVPSPHARGSRPPSTPPRAYAVAAAAAAAADLHRNAATAAKEAKPPSAALPSLAVRHLICGVVFANQRVGDGNELRSGQQSAHLSLPQPPSAGDVGGPRLGNSHGHCHSPRHEAFSPIPRA